MYSKIKIITDKYKDLGLSSGQIVKAYLSLDDGNNDNYNWVAFLDYKNVPYMLDEYVDFVVVKEDECST